MFLGLWLCTHLLAWHIWMLGEDENVAEKEVVKRKTKTIFVTANLHFALIVFAHWWMQKFQQNGMDSSTNKTTTCLPAASKSTQLRRFHLTKDWLLLLYWLCLFAWWIEAQYAGKQQVVRYIDRHYSINYAYYLVGGWKDKELWKITMIMLRWYFIGHLNDDDHDENAELRIR